jgi:hypothetical protein
VTEGPGAAAGPAAAAEPAGAWPDSAGGAGASLAAATYATTQHGAEDQRGQGGQDDAGQLGRRRRTVHLEPIGRQRAAGARQVLDGQPGQDAAHRQDRQRPPHRLGAEAQAVRKMGEDLLLQAADQGQETIRGGGDRHSENRRNDQQLQVAAAAQQRARIRRHAHRSIVRRPGPPRLTCQG